MAKFRGAVKVCRECGKTFKVPPVRAATAFYCSKECADPHRGESRRRRIVLACEKCGKEFESPQSHASRRRFCSNECRNADVRYRAEISRRFVGENNPRWRGGRTKHSDGYLYVYAPDHPFSSNGYVFEHRLVMEAWLREHDPNSAYLIVLGKQKYLSSDYVVHHKDGDRSKNEIGNLVCMTPTEHQRHHNDERTKSMF